MSVEDLSTSVLTVVISSLAVFINFIPALLGGLVVLVIGLVVAAAAHRMVAGTLRAIRLERFLTKYGIVKVDGHEIEWTEILSELARWSIIIIFLIPTFQAWRLDAVNAVLNRILLYIPNVIVAVILAIVGMVFAKLAYKVAYSTSHTLGRETAHAVGLIAQWSLTIFVAFLVLHQLGVAQEMLLTLFQGIVAMLALAIGLAFGLGGKEAAAQVLDSAMKRFKQ